jgi:hypothetical protein
MSEPTLPADKSSALTEDRLHHYLSLIDELIRCPNGTEPDVLDAQPELLDAGLVRTMMQVATVFAHQDNQEGARFLMHVARELSIQLGLYPDSQE